MIVFMLHVFPALLFFAVSLVIAIHHYFIHRDDYSGKAHQESCPACCYLQPSDVRNHEVWVVCGLCIGLTWLIAGWVFMGQCEYI
jgi:hypothetical protein